MQKDLITLDSLNAKNLPELQGLKDKQLELVKECPFVEIVDNQSYELAKKHRTALVKGRTSLESQDKLIASKLTAFRKEVKSVTDELISITLPHEEKQQEEVKRFEQIKENERLEKERIENERIEKIKNSISEMETNFYETISKWDESVLDKLGLLDKLFEITFDAEEFDILLQQSQLRMKTAYENKVLELTNKKNQRIENERLAREKSEADAKLEAIQKQQEKERAEREEKERIEKQEQFEIRKNRLIKLGFDISQGYFGNPYSGIIIRVDVVDSCNAVEFEDLINETEKHLKEEKELNEKKAKEQAEFEAKQQAEKEVKEKADAELKAKAEKENKARVKRLSKDKEIYKKTLQDTLGRFPLFFDSNEIEVKEFSIEASNRVTDLLNELLTDLENL